MISIYFVIAVLLLDGIEMGVYDETVVAKLLKCGFEDLYVKLSINTSIICSEGKVSKIFTDKSLYLDKNALPSSVESFDGYFGLFLT